MAKFSVVVHKGAMELAIVPPLRRKLKPEIEPHALQAKLAEHVERATLELLDPDRIEAIAEDMRVIERHRVHHVGLIVVALVLSALQRSTDTQGRWLDAQRTYRSLGGPDAGVTAFRRMVRLMVPVLWKLVHRRMRQLVEQARDVTLRGRLSAFSDVLIPDGCAFKLARALSGLYPGTGQDAELKLHAVFSVRARSVVSVGSSAGSVHDSDGFWPAKWVLGALYIWDLGYNSYDRFVQAVCAGAHVLQRLKERGNPWVLASYGPTGARRAVVDARGQRMKLNDALQYGWVHARQVLDLDVVISNGICSTVARLVCVPFGGEDRYYLSTLSRAIFTPYDIAELYRVRWEVELLFRQWKGATRLDEIRRLKHPKSLEAAVCASLLAALMARDISVGLESLAAKAQTSADATAPAFSP